MDKFRLNGRTAVVTGAGQGIGEACAVALAEAGARVVVTDVSLSKAQACADRLQAAGREAEPYQLDVARSGEVAALATQLALRYGTIDILVNNAGIARSGTGAEDVSDELWDDVLNVNLNGTFRCCREFGRIMLAAGHGAIVNVGSMAGDIVVRPQNQSYYNASKAAVHHLTRSLATEWARRGIRVNAVAPTYIATSLNDIVETQPDMYDAWMAATPMGRMGTPGEVASVVHFLASDAASLLTGSVVVADGGFTCW